jgi:O-antigen/teichoic acid export membrane protein
VFRGLALVNLAGGAALAAAMALLVPAVFGAPFAGAISAGVVLVAGYALAGLATYLNQCLRGQGRPLAGTAARLMGLAAYVPLGLLGAAAGGLQGAAAAFVLAHAATLAYLAHRTLAHYRGARVRDLVPRWSDVRGLAGALAGWAAKAVAGRAPG